MYCPGFNAPDSHPSESLGHQDIQGRTQLVLDLLEMVHLVAAAEAIAFAHQLRLDLKQFVVLVNDAAGATAAFRRINPFMMKALGDTGADTEDTTADVSLESCIERLNNVVGRARNEACPLFLGNAALGVLNVARHLAGPRAGISSLIRYYGRGS